jgi:hypothetical protein
MHIATSVQQFKWRREYSHSGLFSIPELAGHWLSQESFRTSCDGVVRIIAKNEFDDVFSRWMDRCEKDRYVRIDCD